MSTSAGQALGRFGWDAQWAAAWAEADTGTGVRPGRVVRVERISAQIATESGVETATWVTPVARSLGVSEPCAAGDWVGVLDDGTTEDPEAIACVLPRRTAIVRHDPGGTSPQVLAANMDLVFVVHGLDRPLNEARLERILVVAWDSGAEPKVVLTKADAASPDAVRRVAAELRDIAPAAEVITTSAVEANGTDELGNALGSRTAVLLGESGSGKSTLVNALVGAEVQTTGAVRLGDSKGRHTTSARDLVALSSGGCLIDTPGLRGVGIWEAEEGLDGAFPEIAAAGEKCRFRDCNHTGEPGCAVAAAVDAGHIGARRFESWRRLREEMDQVTERREIQARKRR
jgi:ribosome biogenesis GTPase